MKHNQKYCCGERKFGFLKVSCSYLAKFTVDGKGYCKEHRPNKTQLEREYFSKNLTDRLNEIIKSQTWEDKKSDLERQICSSLLKGNDVSLLLNELRQHLLAPIDVDNR